MFRTILQGSEILDWNPAHGTLWWHHNGCNSISNHQPHDCLLSRLYRRRSKKTSKLRVTGLCVGNSPGTGEFPPQMASNAENVSIWWHHNGNNNGKTQIISHGALSIILTEFQTMCHNCLSKSEQCSTKISYNSVNSHRGISLKSQLIFWVIILNDNDFCGDLITLKFCSCHTKTALMAPRTFNFEKGMYFP